MGSGHRFARYAFDFVASRGGRFRCLFTLGEPLTGSTATRLQLAPRSWFGWQVLSHDAGIGPPWQASPIFITTVTPLKTGRGILKIDCVATLRPLQPKKVSATLQIQYHVSDIIVGKWREEGREWVVAITLPTMNWLHQQCATLVQARPWHMLVEHGHVDGDGDLGDLYVRMLFGNDEIGVLSAPAIDHFLDKPEATPTRLDYAEVIQRYDGLDAWLVVRGFAPAAMEHKWCIRSERRDKDNVLAIYRSWTGFPVWKWRYQTTDTGIELSAVEVGINPEYYTPEPWPTERKRLRAIVEDVLLGRDALHFALIDEER